MIRYHDFWISVGPRLEGGYRVSVRSPAGEGEALVQFDAAAAGVSEQSGDSSSQSASADRSATTREARQRAQSAPTTLTGEALFERVFQGPVRSLFDKSLGQIGKDDGLRIRVHLSPDDAQTAHLSTLPWELLYQRDTRSYLALSERSPIVRYLSVQQPYEPPKFYSPLHVLAVLANPRGTHTLDLQKEREQIERTWASQDRIKVTILEHATRTKLLEELAREDFHVLHYMGHGDFDATSGHGVLLFEDEDGDAAPLTGQALGTLLRDEPSLRLVFLNACQTGAASGSETVDPFAGVASALVLTGIPAVVAMQKPISDTAAVTLADTFYRALARPTPVDAALTAARKAVHVDGGDSLEWATPILFMRAPDGNLFRPEKSRIPPIALAGSAVLIVLIALLAVFGLRKNLVLQPDSITLTPGRTQDIESLVDGETAVVESWASSDTTVATITDGRVLAVGPGTASVSAKIGLLTRASASVLVEAQTASSVLIRPPRASVVVGDSLALRAFIRDADGAGIPGMTVQWTAAPDSIGTVSTSGMVSGRAPGRVTITATATDGTAYGEAIINVMRRNQ